MKTIDRAAPSGEGLQQLVQGSGATGTYANLIRVNIPLATTSTSNAATNWINPETGTVMAKAFVVITVAGTGTFDVGRSSDGTGSSNGMIDGGTLALGVQERSGTAGTAGDSTEWLCFGPGGTGTNNSIVMVHSDGIVSTAAGKLVVFYTLI